MKSGVNLFVFDDKNGALLGGISKIEYQILPKPYPPVIEHVASFRSEKLDLYFWVIGHTQKNDNELLVFNWNSPRNVSFSLTSDSWNPGAIISFYVDKIVVKLGLPSDEDCQKIFTIDDGLFILNFSGVETLINQKPDSYLVYEIRNGRLRDVGKNLSLINARQKDKLYRASQMLSDFIPGLPMAGPPKGNKNAKINIDENLIDQARKRGYKNKKTGLEFTSLDAFARDMQYEDLEENKGLRQGHSASTIHRRIKKRK